MLAASLQQGLRPRNDPPPDPPTGDALTEADFHFPLRQNRRTPLIEAALAPARDRFTEESYQKLCAAPALIFGTESMIVFKDVLGIDEATAREVKRWAVRALVAGAIEEPAGQAEATADDPA